MSTSNQNLVDVPVVLANERGKKVPSIRTYPPGKMQNKKKMQKTGLANGVCPDSLAMS